MRWCASALPPHTLRLAARADALVLAPPQGGFPREPGTLNVGHVRSDHHTVNLTMRSVLDGADEAHGGMRHCPPSAAMGDIGSQHPQACVLRSFRVRTCVD
jgi:hypothetical protein